MSVYLDNAATSFPKPEAVYEAVDHALRRMGVGPGRGGYRRSIEATRIVFEAREAVAALLGVTDSSRVVFTHSATEALNLAVWDSSLPATTWLPPPWSTTLWSGRCMWLRGAAWR